MRLVFILFIFLSYSVYSQKPTCSCSFQGSLSAGLAAGNSPAKPLFQLSAGVKSKSYYLGVGTGIDDYQFHSVPVFADLRYDFTKSGEGFIYGHAGYNFPYNNESFVDWFGMERSTDKFRGGFYMDAGVGYRIFLKGWHRLLISAGYSHKRVSNIIGYTFPCLVAPCPEDKNRYQYDMGRIVTKLSWEISARRGKH